MGLHHLRYAWRGQLAHWYNDDAEMDFIENNPLKITTRITRKGIIYHKKPLVKCFFCFFCGVREGINVGRGRVVIDDGEKPCLNLPPCPTRITANEIVLHINAISIRLDLGVSTPKIIIQMGEGWRLLLCWCLLVLRRFLVVASRVYR